LLFAPRSAKGEAIAHTVLTQGGPVVAAGEAVIIAGSDDRLCTEITNQSGHYLPDEQSLEIGKQAFKAFGITFLGDDGGNGDAEGIGRGGHHGGDDGHHGENDGDGNKDAREIAEARKALADLLSEWTSKKLAEADTAAQRALERAQASPNRDHHIFDQTKHNWDLTGSDQQGNWNLIRTTLQNKYKDVMRAPEAYEVSEPFGNYKVTVTGKVVNGVVRISNAWVNAL